MEDNNLDAPIDTIIAKNVREYGDYVDNHRAFPNLLDGLKPVHRRIIMSALEQNNGMNKTSVVVSTAQNKWHPHGTNSIELAVANLVRLGVLEGQGNFGLASIVDPQKPAAARYTEVKLSESLRTLIKPLLEFIPTHISDAGYSEYDYLPLPVPMALVLGILGIGVGARVLSTGFTPESLLQAYLTNNPRLLKHRLGYDLTGTEFEKLWETGTGQIRMKMKVTQNEVRGEQGFFIEGSPEMMSTNISKMYDPVVSVNYETGEVTTKPFDPKNITIQDMTDSNGSRAWIGKKAKVHVPSLVELKAKVDSLATNVVPMNLMVTHEGKASPISMKDWIDITYKNYVVILGKFKNREIERIMYNLDLLEARPTVSEYLLKHKNKTVEEVSEELDVPLPIVKDLESRSLKYLRSTAGVEADKNRLKKQLKEINSLDFDEFIKDVVSKI